MRENEGLRTFLRLQILKQGFRCEGIGIFRFPLLHLLQLGARDFSALGDEKYIAVTPHRRVAAPLVPRESNKFSRLIIRLRSVVYFYPEFIRHLKIIPLVAKDIQPACFPPIGELFFVRFAADRLAGLTLIICPVLL